MQNDPKHMPDDVGGEMFDNFNKKCLAIPKNMPDRELLISALISCALQLTENGTLYIVVAAFLH